MNTSSAKRTASATAASAAANARRRRDKHIAALVADAPKLTAEQRDAVAQIFLTPAADQTPAAGA